MIGRSSSRRLDAAGADTANSPRESIPNPFVCARHQAGTIHMRALTLCMLPSLHVILYRDDEAQFSRCRLCEDSRALSRGSENQSTFRSRGNEIFTAVSLQWVPAADWWGIVGVERGGVLGGRGQSVPWLQESLENMSICGSGQWHGTDCPPKTERKKKIPTHVHTLTITASLSRSAAPSQRRQSCGGGCVAGHFPTAPRHRSC